MLDRPIKQTCESLNLISDTSNSTILGLRRTSPNFDFLNFHDIKEEQS